MSNVIINPGSGPVAGATREAAEKNIERFIVDLGMPGKVASKFIKECRDSRYDNATHSFVDAGPDGRFEFLLSFDGNECEVEMPGLPESRVRYVGADDQNIWDFPRLYVDGSSWVWEFATGMARASLSGGDDDE